VYVAHNVGGQGQIVVLTILVGRQDDELQDDIARPAQRVQEFDVFDFEALAEYDQ